MLKLLLDADVYAPNPLGRRCLAVCGEQVVWLGGSGEGRPELPAALVSEEVDLGGRRLIPGLVDVHVHLTGGGGEAGPATRVPPLPLSRFTRGGVTSVVGLLGTDAVTRSPRSLVAAARGLVAEGLSAWCWTGGYHLPPATVTGSVRDDVVLVDRVIGLGELALSDHRSSQPTLDELLRLASETHVAGLLTGKAGVVHLHLGDGERGLDLVRRAIAGSELPPRVFHPTHVNRRKRLFDEALDLVATGAAIDVTAFPVEKDEDAWPAVEAVGRFLDAGLPVERLTVSSDGGGCLPRFDGDGRVASWQTGSPGALAWTLSELVRGGRPLETFLPAFTSSPARLLRLPGKGAVAAGADADLVVLDDRGEVSDVMVRGRWHVRDGRALVAGTFEDLPAEDG